MSAPVADTAAAAAANDGKVAPAPAAAPPAAADAGAVAAVVDEVDLPANASPDSCAICFCTNRVVRVTGCQLQQAITSASGAAKGGGGVAPHGVCRDCYGVYVDDKAFPAQTPGATAARPQTLWFGCPVPGCDVHQLPHELIANLLPTPDKRTIYRALWHASQYPGDVRDSKEAAALAATKPAIEPVHGLIELFTHPKGAIESYTAGPTALYHYDVGREYDRGWGCAYRCVQIIVSHLLWRSDGGDRRHASSSSAEAKSAAATSSVQHAAVPTIADIQLALSAELKADPKASARLGMTHDRIAPPSQVWIEPPHVHLYLTTTTLLNGLRQPVLPCRAWSTDYVLTAASTPTTAPPAGAAGVGAAAVTVSARDALERDLWAHFKGDGTAATPPPVMIDDATFAYVIAGIARVTSAPVTGAAAAGATAVTTYVLRFDPHVRIGASQHTSDFVCPLTAAAPSAAATTTPTSGAPAPAAPAVAGAGGGAVARPEGVGVRWMPFDSVFGGAATAKRWMMLYPLRDGPFAPSKK